MVSPTRQVKVLKRRLPLAFYTCGRRKVEEWLRASRGRRASPLPAQDEKALICCNERYAGLFRRVISLLEDDAHRSGITVVCREGVLHLSVV